MVITTPRKLFNLYRKYNGTAIGLRYSFKASGQKMEIIKDDGWNVRRKRIGNGHECWLDDSFMDSRIKVELVYGLTRPWTFRIEK